MYYIYIYIYILLASPLPPAPCLVAAASLFGRSDNLGIIPQTVFSCGGSGGFGKDAGGPVSPRPEFWGSQCAVKINVLSTFCQKLNVF